VGTVPKAKGAEKDGAVDTVAEAVGGGVKRFGSGADVAAKGLGRYWRAPDSLEDCGGPKKRHSWRTRNKTAVNWRQGN
jgi:hypothetical protein